MTHGRGRRRRPRSSWRTVDEVAQLEEAYAAAWPQRAWDSSQPATPIALVFATTAQWSRWRQWQHEQYGDLDLLTIVDCPPIVFVAFQQRSGRWLEATIIETLVDFAQQDGQ